MNNNQALTALIDLVSASDKPVNLDWDETQQWHDGVLAGFVVNGLLSKDVLAQSLECNGCEQFCFMTVYQTDDVQRAFIVCDDPDRQSQMGRINVPLERLQQWRASARQVATVISGLLDLESKPVYQKDAASYKLGMLKGKHGRRWVNLKIQPLALEINRHIISLSDLIYFVGNELSIDKTRIDELLNSAPNDTSKAYTPDVSKRETSKLATQAMYQDWNDAYLALVKKHPNKKDSWYSLHIAKLPISKGRDSETIRHNMKK